jgi:hypothetical protein
MLRRHWGQKQKREEMVFLTIRAVREGGEAERFHCKTRRKALTYCWGLRRSAFTRSWKALIQATKAGWELTFGGSSCNTRWK